MKQNLKWTLLCFTLLISVSCATFDFQADKDRNLIRSNQVNKLVEELKQKVWKDSDDQLIYLFNYGTATQISGDYQESNRAFLLADQLSEIKDYHSLSRITGSLLLNMGMVQYKGDDYEKVLINAYLAINFLMLGQHEAALVETRKINQKLYNYKFEAKRDYEQNPFAHYLAAMIWEADQKWDDAYIDYKKASELAPHFSYLKEDLLRVAARANRSAELVQWKKNNSFSQGKAESKKEWKNKDYGEIILIYQQGWSPRKRPDPAFPRIPHLYPLSSQTAQVRMNIEGVGEEKTNLIYSVEDVAIKTLGDQYAAIVSQRVAGLATKAIVSDQIRQKNSALGDLAWIGMNLIDRADTRQWSTLPQTFQIARYWVKAGTYRINLEGLTQSGTPSGENKMSIQLKVTQGKKNFLSWRSVQ